MLERRSFISTLAAGIGLTAFGKVRSGKPDLTVGVVSDIHLSPDSVRPSAECVRTFERLLRFYRERGVDAVVIAGDFTNSGRMCEMQVTADVWNRVFGSTGGPVKIFVTGNHEQVYFDKRRQAGELEDPVYAEGLYRDIRANWKRLWNEDWSPFFVKQVKGYSFVGVHWGEWKDAAALRRFLSEHADELNRARPFFYVQHAHPDNTCHGSGAWDTAKGVTEILTDYPNAVAFSGHTHYTLADERAVWQGGFTSIGTSALRCVYMPPGRENSNGNGRMPWMRGGSQGLLMTVWGDELALERYDLSSMSKLGDDWVVPVPYARNGRRAFSFDERAKESSAPVFAADAAIVLTRQKGMKPKSRQPEDQFRLEFPAAVSRGDSLSRAFDYRIAVKKRDMAEKSYLVFPPGLETSEKLAPKKAYFVLGAEQLPSVPYTLSVTPRNSYGVEGRPLEVLVEDTVCFVGNKKENNK